jgi:hypothetical protein
VTVTLFILCGPQRATSFLKSSLLHLPELRSGK